MNDKNNDQIKQADHLRKKLKAHHDEARTVLAKKLQVENARRDALWGAYKLDARK